MSQRAKAVVCREINQPVVVEEIEVESPRRGEVTIRLGACGVCHSDLSATNGTMPFPPPVVLGHEGAGTVVEVGEGVTEFAVGDTVLSSFVSMCGTCRYCTTGRPPVRPGGKGHTHLPDGTVRTHDAQGQPLSVFSGCGVMAEVATLHVGNVVKVDARDVKMECCALVSCGVDTAGARRSTRRQGAPGSCAWCSAPAAWA
jgi:Zn-dependent alcohol dehydrogenase